MSTENQEVVTVGKEEKGVAPSYSDLINEKNLLVGKEVTSNNATPLFVEGLAIRKRFKEIPGYSAERVNVLFPDRAKEFFYPIDDFLKLLVQNIDFDKLGPELIPEAMSILIEKYLSPGHGYHSGLMCTKGSDSFFHISHLSHFGGSTIIEDKIHSLIKENNKLVAGNSEEVPKVEEAELLQMVESEKKIFKIHLNLPAEKRVAFFELYFEEMREARSKMSSLRSELDAESVKLNREVAIQHGLGFTQLLSMKFKGFSKNSFDQDLEGNVIPDFVFYLPTNLDESSTSLATKQSLEVIARILVKLGDNQEAKLARYSLPYTTNDGEILSCLSVTQGGSDFKNYLKRIGRLDEFFDKNKNYAVAI